MQSLYIEKVNRENWLIVRPLPRRQPNKVILGLDNLSILLLTWSFLMCKGTNFLGAYQINTHKKKRTSITAGSPEKH